MVRPDLPDNWQDLVAGKILNNLSDDEAATLDQLLQEHPDLLQEVDRYQEAFASYAEAVPLRHPPEQLESRIMSLAQTRLELTKTPSSPMLPVSHLKRLFKVVLGIGGAIAAFLLLGFGLRLQSLSSQLQQANNEIETLRRELRAAQSQAQEIRPVLEILQQPRTLVHGLEGSELASSASGSLILSPDNNQVIIVVHNLPLLADGQIYRLWAKVPTQNTLVYCGQFNSNPQGLIQLTPASDLCGANPTQVVITIDAVTDPTTQGGPLIMHSRT